MAPKKALPNKTFTTIVIERGWGEDESINLFAATSGFADAAGPIESVRLAKTFHGRWQARQGLTIP